MKCVRILGQNAYKLHRHEGSTLNVKKNRRKKRVTYDNSDKFLFSQKYISMCGTYEER